jgi:hypothetical protein
MFYSDSALPPDNIVVCSTPNEASLMQEYRKGLGDFRLICEPDMNDRATAMASRPLVGQDRKPFRHWKLWTHNQPAEVA